jgi:surface polysaccharide O-acyltransferase-like enzyme
MVALIVSRAAALEFGWSDNSFYSFPEVALVGMAIFLILQLQLLPTPKVAFLLSAISAASFVTS